MLNHVIVALILFVAIILFRIEPFAPFRASETVLDGKFASICNLNLTSKDLGFPNVNHLNRYWKNMPAAWRQQYSRKNFTQNVQKIKSQDKLTLDQCRTMTQGVNPLYYHDPGNFAKRFPGVSYYPDMSMPYQEPVDNVSTANHRTIEGLNYDGLALYSLPPIG